jgi:hypothetical protein
MTVGQLIIWENGKIQFLRITPNVSVRRVWSTRDGLHLSPHGLRVGNGEESLTRRAGVYPDRGSR